MSKVSGMKDLGWGILGLFLMAAMAAIGMILLTGAATFSVWVLKWTFPVFLIAFLISLFLVVLALVPSGRGFAAVGLMVASTVFGVVLWLWGMSYTYMAWGLFGVFVGLILLGVGVVPVAMMAALVHGDWGSLITLLIGAVLTFGCRAFAHWLGERADERTNRVRDSEITAEAYPIRE